MTPIINPFIIYLIELLNPLHGFFHVIVVFSAVGCIGNLIYYSYTKDTSQEGYTAFWKEEQIIQNKITETANRVKIEFTDILKIWKDELEGKSNEDKLIKLQSTADHCCMKLSSFQIELEKLTKRFDVYNNTLDFCKKWALRCFVIALLCAFANLLIPSTETAYKMLVAYYITPDNLDLVKNTSKEAVEYIINSIINAIQSTRW